MTVIKAKIGNGLKPDRLTVEQSQTFLEGLNLIQKNCSRMKQEMTTREQWQVSDIPTRAGTFAETRLNGKGSGSILMTNMFGEMHGGSPN